jgi:hypothetical protein
MSVPEHPKNLLEMLDSDNLDDRLMAIGILWETGDESALSMLREWMAVVNKELYALVVAVGKLKRRLGVKKNQSRECIVYCMSTDT